MLSRQQIGGSHGIATHGFISKEAFWRSVPCPTCGAVVGSDCLAIGRRPGNEFYGVYARTHEPRKAAAEKAISRSETAELFPSTLYTVSLVREGYDTWNVARNLAGTGFTTVIPGNSEREMCTQQQLVETILEAFDLRARDFPDHKVVVSYQKLK